MANLKKSKKVTGKVAAQKKVNFGFFSKINFGESYASLFLGIIVVIVAFILVFTFLKANSMQKDQIGQTSSISVTEQMINGKAVPKVYLVKEGDDLWKIAEKVYGSGYNWVDLAKANKLENPEVLFVNTKLNVPNVQVKTLTLKANQDTQPNPITGVSYTVQKGDYLWDIAVRAYGDGYKWVEIAKVNKLVNPNLIYSGNVLKLPR